MMDANDDVDGAITSICRSVEVLPSHISAVQQLVSLIARFVGDFGRIEQLLNLALLIDMTELTSPRAMLVSLSFVFLSLFQTSPGSSTHHCTQSRVGSAPFPTQPEREGSDICRRNTGTHLQGAVEKGDA